MSEEIISSPRTIENLVQIPCLKVRQVGDNELPYEFASSGRLINSRRNVFAEESQLRANLNSETLAFLIKCSVGKKHLERFSSGNINSFANLNKTYQ